MTTTDEGARTIAPFLQRAAELDASMPKIAYYCRMHAVREGLKLEQRSSEVRETLERAMDALERAKGSLTLNEEDDELEFENFALKIFAKADEADRRGSRTVNTAKLYYAASVFLDVLRQFEDEGELGEDLASKRRYAAWRAAEIVKADKEGREPSAPSSMEEKEDDDDAGRLTKPVGNENKNATTMASDEMPSPPSYYPVPPSVSMVSGIAPKSGAPPPGVVNGSQVKAASSTVPQTNARASSVAGAPSRAPAGVAPVDVDIGSIADAHRHAKIAVSALGFDDVHTAIESLERALAILGNIKK
jgi:vacuolar protein sorting-associated protein VTA1